MKRSAVIIAVLLLLLFNMPVYAASGAFGLDEEVEEKALVSAYGYSGSSDEDNETEGNITSSDNESSDNESSDADQSDATVYAFVSSERMLGWAVPNQAELQESDKEVKLITIDDQNDFEVRKPATFMFLIDQSVSMKESGLQNAVDLMEGIRQHYYFYPEQPNYFFRGSKDGDIDNSVNLEYGITAEDFGSLTWTDDADFYRSIDESLEELSRNMREDSGSGWVPGSITSLVLLTDKDPEEIRAASTQIADYPEIVVHTVCFRQGPDSENDTLFSGSTGVQVIIGEESDPYGQEIDQYGREETSVGKVTGNEIASFIDRLTLYRLTLDTTMDSFSVSLSSSGGMTNILRNVKFLDGETSVNATLEGKPDISVLGNNDASTDGSTDESTDGSAEESTEEPTDNSKDSSAEESVDVSSQTDSAEDSSSALDSESKQNAEGENSSNAASTSKESEDTEDESGGFNIPLIAGIACGVLALIIILIVLLRRRDGDTGSGRTSGSSGPDIPVKPVGPEVEDELPDVVEPRTGEPDQPAEGFGRKKAPKAPFNDGRGIRPSGGPAYSAGRESFADTEGLAVGRSGSSPQLSPGKAISIRIEEIEGNYVGKKTEFSVARELLIGNDPTQCDIVFDQEGISPRHSRIYRKGEDLYIEDLGSEGGTYLDGMRLFADNLLRSGDEIGIGFAGFTIRFL